MSRSFGSTPFTTRPSIATLPALTASSPATMRNRVDFPQPDGPTTTTSSPSPTEQLTPCTTSRSPKDLRTLSRVTVAIYRRSLGAIPARLVGFGGQEADDPAGLVERDPGLARARAIPDQRVERLLAFERLGLHRDLGRDLDQHREDIGGLVELGLAIRNLGHVISLPRRGLWQTSAA